MLSVFLRKIKKRYRHGGASSFFLNQGGAMSQEEGRIVERRVGDSIVQYRSVGWRRDDTPFEGGFHYEKFVEVSRRSALLEEEPNDD